MFDYNFSDYFLSEKTCFCTFEVKNALAKLSPIFISFYSIHPIEIVDTFSTVGEITKLFNNKLLKK